jgi:signal transduction histidine kinase
VDIGRWARDRGRAIDLLVVGSLIAVDLLHAAGVLGHLPYGTTGRAVAALGLVCAVPFLWRRQRPILVFVVAIVAWVAVTRQFDLGGYPGLWSQSKGITMILASYAIGSWSEHRRWAVVVPGAVVALYLVPQLDFFAFDELVTRATILIILPWAVGVAARSRRRELDEVRHRAEAAEHDRDEQARRAVVEERAHIARELHDVIGHHVSLMGVQAGAARSSLDTDPEAARAALGNIEEASRQAVGEMRHLLDALREDGSPLDTVPQPGLAGIDGLLAGFRAAGLDVRVTGAVPVGLGAALDLSCYRLVEEALTNVTRHSAADHAEVRFGDDGVWVRIEVEDPGPHRQGHEGTGRGRLGMAERTALFGGTLVDGPTATGGWLVSARMRRDGEPVR